MKKRWILLIVAVALIGFLIVRKVLNRTHEDWSVQTHVVGDYLIENTVTATGTIQPLEIVEVGTQVSGKIEKIYVDYNTEVSKGQLLAELDKLTLVERLSQANANLTSARSQLNYAQQTYDRTKSLYEAKAATQAAFEEASNVLVQAQSNLVTAQANYDQAKVDLGYTEIRSPIDGVVLDRAVEVGQTVAASFSTPTLFTIANDLSKMKVEAAVDEADIGQVKPKQRVRFTVDAYPDEMFNGVVSQIRLQPITTNNVVTYTVVIDAPNPDLKLFPGMTASVAVIIEEQSGLAVPAEAFNFTPDMTITSALLDKGINIESRQECIDNGKGGQTKCLWVKRGDEIFATGVVLGLSDGAYRIVEDGLQKGDIVVLSVSTIVKDISKSKAASNPFMPRHPKR